MKEDLGSPICTPKPELKFPTPDDLYFKLDGRMYKWRGYGEAITSYEGGIKVGEIRAFGCLMFRCSGVERRWFRKPAVTWKWMCDDRDYRAHERLKRAIFLG